ncbi:MAG: ECF transporter S component [Clostridia bacterium]
MERTKIQTMTYLAIFIAIIFVLGLTPLGFIVLPFLPIAGITTVHMPVIIGSYSFGVKGGAILGFFFGLLSLIRCFMTPDATAAIVLGTGTGFGLYNILLIIVIIFLPRILVGVFSALVYNAISRFDKSRVFAMAIAAFIGSITNTVFYLGGLYLFAFNQAAAGFGLTNPTHGAFFKVLLGVLSVNGVAEAIAAVIICTAVGKALYSLNSRRVSLK